MFDMMWGFCTSFPFLHWQVKIIPNAKETWWEQGFSFSYCAICISALSYPCILWELRSQHRGKAKPSLLGQWCFFLAVNRNATKSREMEGFHPHPLMEYGIGLWNLLEQTQPCTNKVQWKPPLIVLWLNQIKRI